MEKLKLMIVTLVLTAGLTACSSHPPNQEITAAQTNGIMTSEEILTSAPIKIPVTESVPIPTEPLADTIDEVDLSQYFEGIRGCAVFYDPSKAQYDLYNPQLCEYASSPCSTFKIVSSLIGLEQGIIDSSNSVFTWNGTEYWKSEWNGDIGFEDAFKTSCIWYFREVINQLGVATVQDGLNQLNYGNCDISDWEGRLNTNNNNRDLTGFWVESSLTISPLNQVEVLSHIFEGAGGYDEENLRLLKEVMLVESNDDKPIYGKTGMGVKDGKCVDAWFVGMFERDSRLIYFAVRLDDPDNKDVSSRKAKEISLNMIREYDGDEFDISLQE